MERFDFVDPRKTPFVEPSWRGELPHLYKDGGTYFVTFRLWDAVVPRSERPEHCGTTSADDPGASIPTADSTITKNAGGTPAPQHWTKNAGGTPAPQQEAEAAGGPCAILTNDAAVLKLAQLAEPPLRLGECLLADPLIAAMVQDSLLHFDEARYKLAAWCIMPNHVHAVFTPMANRLPSEILQPWKSFTSHQGNKILGRRGPIWERESFDHLIRSVENLERFIHYVEENPVVAGLCRSAEDWPWSSAAARHGGPRPCAGKI